MKCKAFLIALGVVLLIIGLICGVIHTPELLAGIVGVVTCVAVMIIIYKGVMVVLEEIAKNKSR